MKIAFKLVHCTISLIIIFTFFIHESLQAQPAGMPPCAPSAAPGESACTATPICDLNGYCGRTLSSYTVDAWQALKNAIITCSSTGFDQLDINNDSYLKFVAGANSISFDVYVYDCRKPVTTKAIQLAVFSAADCSGGPVDVKYCNKQMNQQNTPHNVTINNLTPGETYYILIDGYSSQDCAYSFVATSGVSVGLSVNLSRTTICPGESVTATASGGPAAYSWSGDNGLSASSGSSVTITPPAVPGTYTYRVESSGSAGGGSVFCPSSTDYTFSITVSAGGTPTFNQLGTFCSGENFTLPATSIEGIQGSWSPAVNNMQTTMYTFTPTPGNGQCAGTATMTVVISNQITPQFTNPGPICSGEVFILPAASLEGIQGSWSPAVNTAQTTTYTFTPSGGAGTCPAVPVNMQVVVHQGPVATAQNQQICTGETAIINLTSDMSGTVFSWTATTSNVSGASDGSGAEISQVLTAPDGGTVVYAITPSAGGCTGNPISVTVTVAPSLSVTITPANSTICPGEPVVLTASGATSYTWSPPGGLNTVSGPMVIASPQVTTTYTVNGTSSSGCSGTASVTVTVLPGPLAGFTPSLSTGEAPLEVVFENTSVNASNYIWSFGNGLASTSSETHVSSTYNEPGQYDVILIASNGICTDTAKAIITVTADIQVHVPNVFTPNGDQINDVFYIETTNAKSIHTEIFNRWGNMIVKLEKESESWDGGNSPSGVYFYKYKIVDFSDKLYEGSGFFHLERGKE